MIFHYVECGALMCEEPIPGVTQDVWKPDPTPNWYNGFRYFVAESMSLEAARRIAHGLGGVLWEGAPTSRQLVGTTIDLSRELTRHAMYGEHPRPNMSIACMYDNLHPYYCDHSDCMHCRKVVEGDHNPFTCAFCNESLDGLIPIERQLNAADLENY